MNSKINENQIIKFMRIIDEINMNGDFKDEPIREQQVDAIKEFGSFLTLVPEKDYPSIAFGLLQKIQFFNLSVDGYRFATLDIKTKEKNAMNKDLATAKKYYATISNSPSKALIALVEQNIKDIKHRLNHKQVVDGVIYYKDYQTIEMYKYSDYNQPKKFTKVDIQDWLKTIVTQYKLKDCIKKIKSLTDKL